MRKFIQACRHIAEYYPYVKKRVRFHLVRNCI